MSNQTQTEPNYLRDIAYFIELVINHKRTKWSWLRKIETDYRHRSWTLWNKWKKKTLIPVNTVLILFVFTAAFLNTFSFFWSLIVKDFSIISMISHRFNIPSWHLARVVIFIYRSNSNPSFPSFQNDDLKGKSIFKTPVSFQCPRSGQYTVQLSRKKMPSDIMEKGIAWFVQKQYKPILIKNNCWLIEKQIVYTATTNFRKCFDSYEKCSLSFHHLNSNKTFS